MDKPVLKEHELDGTRGVFGFRFTDGGAPNGLFELYLEDDENWHYKCTFNRLWLPCLQFLCEDMKKKLDKGD
jgi:hypothetical protein